MLVDPPASRDEVVDLLDQLVRIESVTPWLIPTGSGERTIAEFMARWLDGLGLEITLDEVVDGRPNLLARLRGTGGGPTLCLNAHTDTVGFEGWADRALDPWVDGDRMYGIGAVDDKAGCVAALIAIRDLARSGVALRGDLLIALVIDEEGVSAGTEHLVAHHQMDAAIVIEPSALPAVVTEAGSTSSSTGRPPTAPARRRGSTPLCIWRRSSPACTSSTSASGRPTRAQ